MHIFAFNLYPAGIYSAKVINGNTRTTCDTVQVNN